jgi:autotransporter-associated beta strand protein
LALSGSGALSSSTALNLAVSGANFSISGISGTNTEVASLTGVSGSTVSLGGKALTFGGNNANSTFAGDMSGTDGRFIKTGTGTVTLSGSNSMTGTAQLNDGTILIGNNFALGTNSFQIQFDVGGTKTLASDGSTARTLQITNLNLFNNLTLGVASTGTGALTITGRVYLGDEIGQTRDGNGPYLLRCGHGQPWHDQGWLRHVDPLGSQHLRRRIATEQRHHPRRQQRGARHGNNAV